MGAEMCLFTEYTMTVIKETVWKALITKETYLVHIQLTKYGEVIVQVLISRLLIEIFNLLKDWFN